MPPRRSRNLPDFGNPLIGAMSNLRELQNTMEGLFSELYHTDIKQEASGFTPPANAYTSGSRFIVEMGMPGVKRDEISVALDGDLLTVSGRIRAPEKLKEGRFMLHDMKPGTFQRTLRVPFEVQSGKVKAILEDGLLRIVMQRTGHGRKKALQIEVE